MDTANIIYSYRLWAVFLFCTVMIIIHCDALQQDDRRDLMTLDSRQGIKQKNILKLTNKSRHRGRRRKHRRNLSRRKNKNHKRSRKCKKERKHHQKIGRNKKHKRTRKYKPPRKHHYRKPTKKRRNPKNGKNNSPFEGSNCQWIDLCGLKSRAGNCSNGNKAVIKNTKGARKQFLIIGQKVLYGFVTKGEKFSGCQGVTERTASVSCKHVDKSDVADIKLPSTKSLKKNIKISHGPRQPYAGKECEYVDICSMPSLGENCVDGTKFVLKSSGGVRKQFLFTNNKLILAFVKKGSQFADCQVLTDVTSSVTCKAVSGLSGFSLSGSSILTSTTLPSASTGPAGPCTCGKKKVGTRVVGGKPTEVNEYPWMVGLTDEESSSFYFCGGTLVAKQWVVTAAHCIDSKTNLFVTLGDHDMTNDAESVTKTIKVEKIMGHPDYGTNGGNDNDFALLKLSESVDLNTYTPACLPKAGADYTGQNGWIVGWGSDQMQRQFRTDVLNELELPIVSDSVCQKAFDDKGLSYQITSDMLCAGGALGKDGCFGDSGGPFTVDTKGQHYLVGAVSWGEGCARDGLYGVYAEVAVFREWMDKQIQDNGGAEYCTGT